MHVGIIGGGITGLSAAYYLQKAGVETTIVEHQPSLGGLASAHDFGPFHWDKFYHCILTTDHALLSFLGELGLGSELRWTETKTGFFSKKGLHSMSNLLEFLLFPPLSLWEKFRLGLGILYAARLRNTAKLEEIPIADWLIKVFGRGNFKKVWGPLLNCKLGASQGETSAAWIWATIFRYYSTREKNKSKKEMLGYVRGGYRAVLARLVERLQAQGTQFLLDSPVERIESAPQGGVRIHARGATHDFDQVVFTGPSALMARLTPELDPSYAEKLHQIRYLGVVCAVLLLRRPLSRFYITNLIEPGLPFTGVVEMTALISREETAGRHLVYLPKYTVPGDPTFSLSDEDIWKQMKQGLERVHPDLREEDIEKVSILRAPYVQPIPVLRYSRLIPEMETNIPGLFLANSTFIVNGTLNNNEMIQIARRVADLILHARRAHNSPKAVPEGCVHRPPVPAGVSS